MLYDLYDALCFLPSTLNLPMVQRCTEQRSCLDCLLYERVHEYGTSSTAEMVWKMDEDGHVTSSIATVDERNPIPKPAEDMSKNDMGAQSVVDDFILQLVRHDFS